MKKISAKGITIDVLVDIAAGMMIAFGVYNLASPAEFPLPGISGVALMLYQLFKLPIGLMTFVMNVPIILCTFRILGRRFFLKSLKSIIITSVIMDVVAPLLPVFTMDKLLAALCCGVLSGAGYALVFMRDSSCGGIDFITMAIRAKKPHISMGVIIFILDLCIIVPGAILVSKDIESLIYGIIIAYLGAVVTNRLMCGLSQGKVTMIVTKKGPEVCQCIDQIYGRGSTILKGMGSYTHEDQDVIMCACNNKQMYGIRKLIKQIDPHSFMVIMESSDVVGEGFQTE